MTTNLAHPHTRLLQQLLRPRLLAAGFALLAGLFAWGALSVAQTGGYTTEPVGTSAQGRPINAYRFGSGPTRLAFIGGLHQGDESISTNLINRAIEYYSQHPAAIPRELTVIFIPNANPDGFVLKTRTNSRGVDLNRNWPTEDWKADTFTSGGQVQGGGGRTPLSEPETASLWNYIRANKLLSVIWYHARGGMIVDSLPTFNGRRLATQLAQLLAASTGYTYKEVWNDYDISGDASDFLNSQGIYSLTIELTDYNDIEWTRNLRGFSSAMSFFTPRLADTGKVVTGQLLGFYNSNGGARVMGNPVSEQQIAAGRVWQQFENGTITLDVSSGMVGWQQGARAPAPDLAAIAQARPPVPLTPIAGPNASNIVAADKKSAGLRDSINRMQQQASQLHIDLAKLAQAVGQPVQLPAPSNSGPAAAPAITSAAASRPALTVPALTGPTPTPVVIGGFAPSGAPQGQARGAPTIAGADVPKAVKVVLGPSSTASVFAYERGRLVRTLGAFSGMPGHETPRGEFKIRMKTPSLQTNKWYENDGTEYILKNYASFTGPSLGYSDDWAFHQLRIPVSGPEAGQLQSGPSHGCLALSPADAAWFYAWATEGTEVTIY